MKTSIVILLIGAFLAVAYAAPYPSSKVEALMQDGGDDDLAKTARWLGIARRVIGGLNHAVNGEREQAENQDEEDDGDGDDKLLSQVLLQDFKGAELEQVTAEDDGDDGGDDEKATAQFHVHFHFG